jgi:hypothetical protein
MRPQANRARSLGVLGGNSLGMGDESSFSSCSRGNVNLGDTTCLDAVYTYIENQRPLIAKYPKLQPLIESFEGWYQNLSWTDKNIMSNDTFDEAVRRRDAINAVMGEVLPATWIPGDVARTAPPPPPPGGTPWPLWLKVTLGFAGAGLVVYALHDVVKITSLFKAPAKAHE